MPIAILFNEKLKEYDFGQNHPFRSERYKNFLRFLEKNLSPKNYQILRAKSANDKDLALICQKDYLEFNKNYFQAKNFAQNYQEKFFQYHSYDNFPSFNAGNLEKGARIIVGQAKLACDLIEQGKFKKVVSLGGGMHHAKANYGEGFCLYNDVAFAGKYLIKKYKLKRILILDTDAHCGNGTLEYFYSEPKVLFIDLHQDPKTIYPGTGFVEQIGEKEGKGFTINIPLPQFAGDLSYKLVFEEIVEPVVREFRPQIIIKNGGSDPHFGDELTQLGLSLEGLRMIGEKVRKMAKICQGKVIDMIASGYNQKILPLAWGALIFGLMGLKIKLKEPAFLSKNFKEDSLKETQKIVAQVKNLHKPFWKCFK